jgi:hypothetical protein
MKKNILQLISGDDHVVLPSSDGSRLICNAGCTFPFGINTNFVAWGINKPGIATQETLIRVHKIIGNCDLLDIFEALSGKWSQKWLSQNQVIDFCEIFLPDWIKRAAGRGVFALIKKDENKPIDESRPKDNMSVVYMHLHPDGLRTHADYLECDDIWDGEYLDLLVISPQILSTQTKNILRLVYGDYPIILPISDGSRLICQAADIFKACITTRFVAWGLNKPGVRVPEIIVQVHEVVDDAKFVDIFEALPGTWNQKFLSQNQVVDFCEILPECLRQIGYSTFFLIKRNESELIDENKPADNLFVVHVIVVSNGLFVHATHLENYNVRNGKYRYHVVSPRLSDFSA